MENSPPRKRKSLTTTLYKHNINISMLFCSDNNKLQALIFHHFLNIKGYCYLYLRKEYQRLLFSRKVTPGKLKKTPLSLALRSPHVSDCLKFKTIFAKPISMISHRDRHVEGSLESIRITQQNESWGKRTMKDGNDTEQK